TGLNRSIPSLEKGICIMKAQPKKKRMTPHQPSTERPRQNLGGVGQRRKGRRPGFEASPLADLNEGKAARVLLIEDDRSTRRMIAASLKDHCDLTEAPNASQGITAYNALEPDLVFLDIELPDGDGQSILKW